MRCQTILAAAALAVLAGCQTATTPATDGYVRLADRASLAPTLDRRLTLAGSPSDYVVIRSDGTLEGEFGGVPTAGTWEMRDGYFCRVLTEGTPQAIAAGEDCQISELRGNRLRVTRDRGAGSQFEYILG
jgi:hypothetical protein